MEKTKKTKTTKVKETKKVVTKKQEVKETKKVVAKKQPVKKEKKQSLLKRIANFLKEVKKELGKVKWPSKKSMSTHTTATILFILVFAAYFTLVDYIIAGLKVLVA